MPRSIHPVAAVLAAVLSAAVVSAAGIGTAGPASAGTGAEPRTRAEQPFRADSGDDCPYGVTEGTLDWYPPTAPPGLASVVVRGSVGDQPLPIDPVRICEDDGWRTVAVYSAYRQRTLVDEARIWADNDVVPVTVGLAPNTPPVVDSVVVRVCRVPADPRLRPMYCGAPQVHRPDAAVTTGR
ncbi:hypothetical protein [Plantactinospora sp. DSM 117369]